MESSYRRTTEALRVGTFLQEGGRGLARTPPFPSVPGDPFAKSVGDFSLSLPSKEIPFSIFVWLGRSLMVFGSVAPHVERTGGREGWPTEALVRYILDTDRIHDD